jgi:hypothetical protein
LGIRDLYSVNKVLLIQAAWNVATHKNPMLLAILKAKYYPNSSFCTGTKSIFWSSILQVKQELSSNSTLQIHSGNSSIWSTPWCPVWDKIHDHMLLPVTQLPMPTTVSELWHPETTTWNVNYIANIFDTQDVQAIAEVPIVPSDQNDILRWIPAKDGKCSTKNIYRCLAQ